MPFSEIRAGSDTMGRRRNVYIKSIGTNSGQVREDGLEWNTNDAAVGHK